MFVKQPGWRWSGDQGYPGVDKAAKRRGSGGCVPGGHDGTSAE